ncbi:DUF6932 family protein [Naumannella halotolerans]|uniref:Uncharacterized protein n=1 Tax=Naumannella halotolerans TaxID=993414 RepID=A0A4R7IYV7_9ACTN|nr:hypothetical protein [Naumannella halotolerans]TDT29079.1 hypothetical protein CLV29_3172 [Naumannella halotolerans]
MAIPALVNGTLPLGRWPASEADLDAFASAHASTARREKLLQDWRTLTDAVRSAVDEVAACWLSGSFLTDKEQPGDIDAVFLVNHERINEANTDPKKALFLQVVARSQVRQLGLEVDSYMLAWWPRPGVFQGTTDRRESYLQERGYWDDLWSRTRETAKPHVDKLPRRGYVEVILDGYR